MSWFTRMLRISRVLREMDGPSTPIARLVEGRPTRIVGVAEAIGPLLTTPVDPRPCIGFRLVVERRSDRSSNAAWVPVLVQEDCRSFSVQDESGLAVVEAPVVLRIDVDVGGWAGLPPEVYDLLDEAKIPLRGAFSDPEFRFSLAVLKPGDRISVEGRATLQIDPSVPGASARSAPQTWHFKDTNAWPLVVRDVEDPAL